MKLQASQSVGEIAVEMPQAIPYFEQKGVDYCCGGTRTLQEACGKAGIEVEEALQTLGRMEQREDSEKAAPTWLSLQALIQHILDKHHTYTRSQLELLVKLGSKVLVIHGQGHAELLEVNRIVGEMARELNHHLLKEEQVAFPFLLGMEAQEGPAEGGQNPFSYEVFRWAPQQVLLRDHEATGELLADLRQLTNNYVPPPGACVTFQAFYRGLRDLEADLHQHIHLENNVLFPMAEKLAANR